MKYVFWNVTTCGSCKNRRLEGTYFLLIYEISVVARTTGRNIPEDGILLINIHSSKREWQVSLSSITMASKPLSVTQRLYDE
jgi:hypothetical protein